MFARMRAQTGRTYPYELERAHGFRGRAGQCVALITWTLLCAVSLPVPAAAFEPPALTQVARRTVEYYFETERLKKGSLSRLIQEFPAGGQSRTPSGVFVTLSRDGKSRACWGTLTPEHKDLVESTVYATVGALTREYRFAPIRASELQKLKVQVTVVKAVQPIHGINDQNPLADGLLVRSGGKSGVLLPGEASDAYYQLVQCKLKAGIKPGEPCQLYRIRADVYQ